MFNFFFNLIKEIKDCIALFSASSAKARRVVFYSESDIYYQYYEGIINELLGRGDIEIAYITSDINDSIFKRFTRRIENEKKDGAENKAEYGGIRSENRTEKASGGGAPDSKVKVFYINNLLSIVMIYLDSKVFLMTMPDLGNFHIKRSINAVHYIYVFHAIGSTHLQYRQGAFDNYDAVFCVGAHHVAEIKKTEKLYELKPKTLIECGYHRLEKIWRDHGKYAGAAVTPPYKDSSASPAGALSAGVRPKLTVLIAPTWTAGNILDSHIFEIIDILKKSDDINAVIRPHPEYIKRCPGRVAKIADYITGAAGISMELEMLKDENLHRADVLITDWSCIYLEYALGTARPVLFIDTPCRIDNKEYERLGIEPMELALRPLCGIILKPDNIASLIEHISVLINEGDKYSGELLKLREKYIYNFLNSSKIAADYIFDRLNQ